MRNIQTLDKLIQKQITVCNREQRKLEILLEEREQLLHKLIETFSQRDY